MNSKQNKLIAEYRLVQDNTTDTYTPREYAGLALSCGAETLTPGHDSNSQYIEAAKILRKVK